MLPRVKNKRMNKNILFLKLRSNAPHRLLSTQSPPCCARQPNDVISVLAGPLKRRLAALICIVHPTGCTTGCKCKHRATSSSAPLPCSRMQLPRQRMDWQGSQRVISCLPRGWATFRNYRPDHRPRVLTGERDRRRIYGVRQKKWGHRLTTIILSNLNNLKKFSPENSWVNL